MPANHIKVNNKLECFVADTKMEELMKWLQQNAYDWREENPTDEAIYCSQTEA